MKVAYRTPAVVGTTQSAPVFGLSRTGVRSIDQIRDAVRALWPVKTAPELSIRTRTSVRACEYFLAGRCGLSAESLANLLRSDAGLTILENIMGAGAPAWWGSFRRQAEIGRLRREQSALRERIEKLTE